MHCNVITPQSPAVFPAAQLVQTHQNPHFALLPWCFQSTNSTYVHLQKNTDVPTSQILAMFPTGWWQDLALGVWVVAPNPRQPQPSALSTEHQHRGNELSRPAADIQAEGCYQ